MPAQHSPDGTTDITGEVTGFVPCFVPSGAGIPTISISGDNASLDVVRAVAGRFPRIDVAVPFAGAARSSLLDGYLTLTSDGAAEPPRSWAAPTVVPAHAEGWGHFTERINEIVAAFTRHGLSDRLRVIAPGDTAAV